METYLRMMFLKFRYRLSYDSLCREVADSITWRRFCRIPLKRQYGWDHTRLDTTKGARIWAGHGIPGPQPVKIAAWLANLANNQDQGNKMRPALGPLPPKLTVSGRSS